MFGLIRLVQAEESHNLGYNGRFMQALEWFVYNCVSGSFNAGPTQV